MISRGFCGYRTGVPHTEIEVERAFSPGSETELPDLTVVTAVRIVEPVGEDELDATYYDVPGLILLHAGVTLRRRTGGPDEGWHLKLPGPDPSGRAELHADLGSDGEGPPAELSELVSGWSRGIALAPVARLRTTRHTSRLVGADGLVLAEVTDDHVVGLPAQVDAAPRRWREWEVELRHGTPALLDEVEELLADHGVRRSVVQRKLALVLDDAPRDSVLEDTLTKDTPAARFLHRRIAEQAREIELLDPLVREGGTGGVHGMRKASRRLRAALATFRPLVEREQTDPVRDELRWLARSLGPARDDEVVLERIGTMLDEAPEEAIPQAGRRVLEKYAVTRASEDLSTLAAVLSSQRYFTLRAALDALVAEPPWTATADEAGRDVLPPLVRKEWKRVKRRRRGDDPHDLRKAAKRLRYAYEVVEPVWGKAAARPRKAARELTGVLGDRQDTLASREWLVALSAEAARGSETAFVFGYLYAIEARREVDLLGQVKPRWRDLKSVRW